MKQCTVCKDFKSLDKFYNRKASEDGKAYRCKDCDNLAVGVYRKKHVERFRKNSKKAQLLSKYGLTLEDYEALLEAQGKKCVICLNDFEPVSNSNKRSPVVDHCHSSGRVRAVICRMCNQGLGLFHDNQEALTRAAAYLEKHKEKNSDIH